MTNIVTSVKYRGYTGVYSWDPQTGVYSGEVLYIEDFVSFHGRTTFEIQKDFEGVINDYLEWQEEDSK